ncbi:MAG: HD domain-containing protein [Pseudomonadales bacterium]|nr:HD domain-containing protein [Pseudomonadales bacterium]
MDNPGNNDMDELFNFLMALDKLKKVHRRAYIFDQSRNENSAEHSWHLAISLIALKTRFAIDIDFYKAIKMALVHDICEIGAGDISVYHPHRADKIHQERLYINQLLTAHGQFATEIKSLWEEYEAQQSAESHWVKIVDRLLPFMMNINTEGKCWQEQQIKRSQVLEINQLVAQQAPEIYRWMLKKIDRAVQQGWLIDA